MWFVSQNTPKHRSICVHGIFPSRNHELLSLVSQVQVEFMHLHWLRMHNKHINQVRTSSKATEPLWRWNEMETWKFACKRARQDSTPGFDCCFFAAQHEQFLAGVGCLQVKTLSKPPNYQPIPCYSSIKTCVRTILIKTVSEKNCVRNVKYSYSNELFPDFSDIRMFGIFTV